MNWPYFIDLLDTTSPLVTLGFGVYAATNDTTPLKDGKLSRQGKIALWGLIISGVFTMMIKVRDLNVKVENEKELVKEKEKAAFEKDSALKAQLAFQDSVAESFKQSLSELSSLKEASKTTLYSLNEVADDQRTTLLTTRRGLNPLLPVEIRLGYELFLDDILEHNAHKREIDFYLDKLAVYAKERLLQIRSVAGHRANSIDTTNINFDPMDIPDPDLLKNGMFRNGHAYFSVIMPTMFNVELQHPSQSQPNIKKHTLVEFQIVAKKIDDTIPYQKKFETLSSIYNAKRRTLQVEIGPVSPATNVTDFVSLYDLENALLIIPQPRSSDNGFARLENMNCFTLSYITINTGFKLSKSIHLEFTPKNKHNDKKELYARVIKPEEIQ